MKNQDVTTTEIEKIRTLDDFDMIMLISEIHDYSWDVAKITLAAMPVGSRRTH